MDKYEPSKIEPRWQEKWLKNKIYQPDLGKSRRPFYNLMMFPYPSAEGLHVGNLYAFTGSDIYGRFKRMQGLDVFEPIGLDGFGIHSENYAIKVGRHPKEQAKISQANFYRQLQATGNAYAWDNTLETYDPDYYKWTQWIFVQMYKKGLAYRKKSAVNWCPNCKTTLSDEQVLPAGRQGITGACERCKTIVEKRELEQWFFKITDYAERLLDGLNKIDWSEKVKIAQRNWIGKSEGALIKFQIPNSKFQIEVFTTAHDTIYGASFMVLSPKHPLVKELAIKTPRGWQAENHACPERSRGNSSEAEEKEKSGFFTGLYCINPFNNEKIPIWIANYVLMEYGTGAIMGVPGHDVRDHEFARKYGLAIRPVIKPPDKVKNRAKVGEDGFWDYEEIKTRYVTESIVYDSDILNGLSSQQARAKIEREVEKRGLGKRGTQYHLRDWCISRQRYWGPPIPMINCGKCGWVSVREKDLPVLLPQIEQWRPEGEGASPLAKIPAFVKTTCPECGAPAKRETDVSDTFLDSAWYFLRYPSVKNSGKDTSDGVRMHSSEVEGPWDSKITKKWLPVNMYIGGAEHSVLHLMYSRFLTMVFHDWGLLDFKEPFTRFYAHGLLISEGAKMSKSRGNVVIPDEYIKVYGADTLRCYLMFLGRFNQGGDFRDTGMTGTWRFLRRVWQLTLTKTRDFKTPDQLLPALAKTVKKVSEDLENLRFNTAIAAMMEFINLWTKPGMFLSKKDARTFLQILAPFAPHISEELWEHLGGKFSIHTSSWPKYNQSLIKEEEVMVVVEINGKVRDKLTVKSEKLKVQSEIEKMARGSEKASKYLAGKKVKQTIFIPGKLINFVTN